MDDRLSNARNAALLRWAMAVIEAGLTGAFFIASAGRGS